MSLKSSSALPVKVFLFWFSPNIGVKRQPCMSRMVFSSSMGASANAVNRLAEEVYCCSGFATCSGATVLNRQLLAMQRSRRWLLWSVVLRNVQVCKASSLSVFHFWAESRSFGNCQWRMPKNSCSPSCLVKCCSKVRSNG